MIQIQHDIAEYLIKVWEPPQIKKFDIFEKDVLADILNETLPDLIRFEVRDKFNLNEEELSIYCDDDFVSMIIKVKDIYYDKDSL